jgi:hypothetical protein
VTEAGGVGVDEHQQDGGGGHSVAENENGRLAIQLALAGEPDFPSDSSEVETGWRCET